jgi:TfoX/Sxy family transcriptional regulator of competence genes
MPMKWTKSPPALVALFESLITAFPKSEKKRMFGYPSIFINGNLTAGLFEDRMMLRLSEEDRKQFLKERGHRVFEPMPGRPMKEYVEASAAMLEDPKKLIVWLERSVSYAQSLKPKSKKAARKGGR